MTTLYYDTMLSSQYDCAEKAQRQIHYYISYKSYFPFNLFLSVHDKIRETNEYLTMHLMQAKGAFDDVKSKEKEIFGKDLNNLIEGFTKIVKSTTTFHSEINEIITSEQNKKYPELHVTEGLLASIIDTTYDIIIVLKKCNIKITKEASILAKESALRTQNTLHKLYEPQH